MIAGFKIYREVYIFSEYEDIECMATGDLKEKGRVFSRAFWTNSGKKVEAKPQNPIAARQAMYNKDERSHKISLAQGMVFNDKDRIRVYDPELNKWYNSVDQVRKQGGDPEKCRVFVNRKGKVFHSPATYVAKQRALKRFGQEQFGDDLSLNPAAYGTPLSPALMQAIRFDGDDIYGAGKYASDNTVSFQTVGMASGYKHLVLPVINSVRKSVGLPGIKHILMGTNFYGAYPATFGEQNILRYRYMDNNGDFDLRSFKKAAMSVDPETSIFLFDMSTGNNFIGTLRTKQDNENIVDVLIDKHIYSEHDIAYPNYKSDFDPDWEIYRILQQAGVAHGVQSSRGKKDKYASRLSFHHLYLGDGEQRTEIFSHLVTENRNTFLAMPDTWGHLVELSLDPSLKQAHEKDIQDFVTIVNDSRKNLSEALGWSWMKERSGMFDMINISHKGVDAMGEEHAIYAVPTRNQNMIGQDGLPVEVTRIKHGLPMEGIVKVAEAIKDTIRKYPSETGKMNPEVITAD